MFLKKEKLVYLFVATNEENYLSFKDTLIGKDSTKRWVVPGSTSGKEVVRATELSRVCMLKLVELGWTFNYHGWSFGGELSAEDLLMTYTGELRVNLEKWNILMAASPTNVESQWNSIASIIRGVIFSGKVVDELPVDVVKLLKLLEKLNPENFGALPQHPALKDEVDTLAQFSEMYMELLQVKQTDGGRYNKVVSKLLPFCPRDQNHWKLKSLENIHLEGVLRFASPKPYERKKHLKQLQNDSGNHNVYIVSHLPQLKLSDQNRIALVLLHERELDAFMDPDRLHMILDLIQSGSLCFGPYGRGDRFAFFRFLLNDMMLTYNHDGGDLITDIRNCGQHLIGTHSIQTISGSGSATESLTAESASLSASVEMPATESAPMPATKPFSAGTQPLSVESASLSHSASSNTESASVEMPADTAPMPATKPFSAGSSFLSKEYKILFKYFQVVHIIVSCHPAIFSEFFMAAYKQGLVKKSTEKPFAFCLSEAVGVSSQ